MKMHNNLSKHVTITQKYVTNLELLQNQRYLKFLNQLISLFYVLTSFLTII